MDSTKYTIQESPFQQPWNSPMRHGSQQPCNGPGFDYHRPPGHPQWPPSVSSHTPSSPHAGHPQWSASASYTPSSQHAGHPQWSMSAPQTPSPPCIPYVDHNHPAGCPSPSGMSSASSEDYLFANDMEREGAFLTGQAEFISNLNKARAKSRMQKKEWRKRGSVQKQTLGLVKNHQKLKADQMLIVKNDQKLKAGQMLIVKNDQKQMLIDQKLKAGQMLIDAMHQRDDSNKDCQKQADERNKLAQKQADESNHSAQKDFDESNKNFQEKLISKVADTLSGIETVNASESESLPSPGPTLGRPPRPPPPPPSRGKGQPPPPPPPGWTQQWSTGKKKHFYTNCETCHSQWHYPTASDVTDPWKAKDTAKQRVASEKPSSLKRARKSDEQQLSSKKRAVAICSNPNDKERLAGVPLYQQRGHLMLQANKDTTVSIESYLKQKSLVDGLENHIAALQDENCALKKAVGSKDLLVEFVALEKTHEGTKRSMAALRRNYGRVTNENARFKAENARFKTEIARLKKEYGA